MPTNLTRKIQKNNAVQELMLLPPPFPITFLWWWEKPSIKILLKIVTFCHSYRLRFDDFLPISASVNPRRIAGCYAINQLDFYEFIRMSSYFKHLNTFQLLYKRSWEYFERFIKIPSVAISQVINIASISQTTGEYNRRLNIQENQENTSNINTFSYMINK